MSDVIKKYHKNWYLIALFNFALAATAGLILRLAFVTELPIDYFHIKHAHSHVALLGWLYLALYALINHYFVTDYSGYTTTMQYLFWLTEVCVIGMFTSFALQGYHIVSVSFSVLYILCTYGYIYCLWKSTRDESGHSYTLLRTALLWLFVSTVGALSMGPIVALDYKNTIIYHMAIQFFLHFQLNGWIVFAILAVFFKYLEKNKVIAPNLLFQVFFILLISSCILTYALAVAWASHTLASYIVNAVGVALQLGALFTFLNILYRVQHKIWQQFIPLVRLTFGLALAALIIKILMQSGAVFPEIAEMSHTIKNLVIGFIHMLVLGFASTFLLGAGSHLQFIPNYSSAKWGIYVFLAGVVSTEILLFLQGLFFWLELGFLPYYYFALFCCSIFLFGGVVNLFIISAKSSLSANYQN